MRSPTARLVVFSLALSTMAACGPSQHDAGCGNAQACTRSRPILRGDVVNARDLGGVPLAQSGSAACGALFRGPPLAALSPLGCADAAALGLRTILDLRTDGERAVLPDDACVGAQIMSAPLPIPYNLDTAAYQADFDSDDSIARVFHTLADDAAYPIYVHCTYGRDRTGVVAAAVLLALGASRADVVAEYSLSASTVGAWPRSLEGLLDEIDARGGIEAALATKGVTAEDLAALRARVTAR
jgi:hypothetical protein